MNLENQLIEKFQVEELEKRYEFAWIEEIVIKPLDPPQNPIPFPTPPPAPAPIEVPPGQ